MFDDELTQPLNLNFLDDIYENLFMGIASPKEHKENVLTLMPLPVITKLNNSLVILIGALCILVYF